MQAAGVGLTPTAVRGYIKQRKSILFQNENYYLGARLNLAGIASTTCLNEATETIS